MTDGFCKETQNILRDVHKLCRERYVGIEEKNILRVNAIQGEIHCEFVGE